MNCPSCTSNLDKRLIRDIEIDECKTCEGIWFDQDELRKVKDKTDSDLNWMDFEIFKYRDKFGAADSEVDCPKCNVSMKTVIYDTSTVEIEFCDGCKGIWLDRGELQGVLDYLQNEIMTKPLDEYLRATIKEAKELIIGPESFVSQWKDFSTILRFLQYRILAGNPEVHDKVVTIQKNPFNQ